MWEEEEEEDEQQKKQKEEKKVEGKKEMKQDVKAVVKRVESLNKFEQLRARCGSLDPLHAFEYLRKICKPISQCHYVLNVIMNSPPSTEKADNLLLDLRRVIAEWKFERSFQGNDGAAAKAAAAAYSSIRFAQPYPAFVGSGLSTKPSVSGVGTRQWRG